MSDRGSAPFMAVEDEAYSAAGLAQYRLGDCLWDGEASTDSDEEAATAFEPRPVARRTEVIAQIASLRPPLSLKLPAFPKSANDTFALIHALRDNYLFSEMDSLELHLMIDALQEVTFEAGTLIFEEGAAPVATTWFYVIMEGQCESHVNGTFVRVLGPGNTLGSRAMKNCTSALSTVQAKTAVRTYGMKRKVYRRLLAFLGKQRIQTFVRCLAQSSFAHVLSLQELHYLVEAFDRVRLQPEDHLLRAGQPCCAAYLVLQGFATIRKHTDEADASVPIRKLGRLTLIGENEFLTGQSPLYDCKAVTPMHVAKLDRKTFELLFGDVGSLIEERRGSAFRLPCVTPKGPLARGMPAKHLRFVDAESEVSSGPPSPSGNQGSPSKFSRRFPGYGFEETACFGLYSNVHFDGRQRVRCDSASNGSQYFAHASHQLAHQQSAIHSDPSTPASARRESPFCVSPGQASGRQRVRVDTQFQEFDRGPPSASRGWALHGLPESMHCETGPPSSPSSNGWSAFMQLRTAGHGGSGRVSPRSAMFTTSPVLAVRHLSYC
eukprot:EG_transcript_6716